ncbi:class I SAM-dependent methyltransferase [Paenibacillus sp. GCM10023252]|uniref:class I SAM-dependent methyltransferase n=1 Tax=Paenibacillus sp. GCM10023252 TaxID=3252649 RepID=UPI00361C4B5A
MTEQWQQDIQQWIHDGKLQQATLSGLRRKDAGYAPRTVIRPIQLKDGLYYQFESHHANKALHTNVPAEDAASRCIELVQQAYKQVHMKLAQEDVQILFSKRGKATILRRAADNAKGAGEPAQHNRQKQRIIPEGSPAPFLVELGIMTRDGKVHAQKQDKYRQINRFLEMVNDVVPHLPKDRELTIVDFGCGKSYLTFALYHLLHVVEQREVRIIGLDLKADVISFCSKLAAQLGYDRLQFQVGDIAEFDELVHADMVVTLHACDTATDAALAKAVGWGASVILSVPCCQHEVMGQVKNDVLSPILSQGLLKERFSALATDAARGALLETLGYKVQMLEFIDPEHTPKNLLIRAFRGEQKLSLEKWKQYTAFRDHLQINPALERLLSDRWPI